MITFFFFKFWAHVWVRLEDGLLFVVVPQLLGRLGLFWNVWAFLGHALHQVRMFFSVYTSQSNVWTRLSSQREQPQYFDGRTWTSSCSAQTTPCHAGSRRRIFSVTTRKPFSLNCTQKQRLFFFVFKDFLVFWLTFFLSGSSLYFLDSILVRSKLLISGCNFAYLALFSMKKRKYGVRGFLGKSGCFCFFKRE